MELQYKGLRILSRYCSCQDSEFRSAMETSSVDIDKLLSKNFFLWIKCPNISLLLFKDGADLRMEGFFCKQSPHTLLPTSLQPIYPSRHCAQTRRSLQVFNQSIPPDIVLRQDVTYKSSTNLSLQTLCSDKTLPTSLQPIYPYRNCTQTRRYLQVFNQSIPPDIVLRQDVTYKSSTNLFFQTLCSVPTSLQPIYSSRHCVQFLQVFNQSILPDIVFSSYKSSTNLFFQTLCSVPTNLQPIYSSRHCAQFLQIFNQSILPDIVLSSYKSSTNISIQTLCSVPTSLQPIYSSRHCAQFLQIFNQSILPDIVLSSYKSSTNISIQTLCSVPTSLQPIYLSRHHVKFLQVFNQSILPMRTIKSTVQRSIEREHRIKRQRNKVLNECAG